jgi:hypothetical protein
MAANTPTHKSPAVQKLNTLLENNVLKTPESPEKVHYEVRLKEVVLDMCIYEVTSYTWDANYNITSFEHYSVVAPCPGQGFPVTIYAGGWIITFN